MGGAFLSLTLFRKEGCSAASHAASSLPFLFLCHAWVSPCVMPASRLSFPRKWESRVFSPHPPRAGDGGGRGAGVIALLLDSR